MASEFSKSAEKSSGWDKMVALSEIIPDLPRGTPKKGPEHFKLEILNAIEHYRYRDAMTSLMELQDFRQNIYWRRINHVNFSKNSLIIRDARDCLDPINTTEPYVIMALSYIKAAKTLLPPEEYESSKDYFRFMIEQFFIKLSDIKYHEKEVHEEFGLFNSALINKLASQLKIPFNEAKKRLTVAKDFVNLDTPALNIVTLTEPDKAKRGETAVQADFPICELTQSLRGEYTKIKDLIEDHKGNYEEIDQSIKRKPGEYPEWFTALPVWGKKLVGYYIDNILSEWNTLPTQLRKVSLPGQRNFNEVFVGISSVSNEGMNPPKKKMKIVAHGYRSGTPTTHGKHLTEENKRLAIENAKQIIEAVSGKQTIFISLNTLFNKGDDPKIVTGSRSASKKVEQLFADFPINVGRRVSPPNYSGINILLERVAGLIPKFIEELKALQIFLDPNTSEPLFTELINYISKKESVFLGDVDFYNDCVDLLSKIRKAIEGRGDSDLKAKLHSLCNICEVSLKLRYYTSHPSVIDKNNHNLYAACYTSLLVNLTENFEHFDLSWLVFCASGKDRTGLVQIFTATIALYRDIYGEYPSSFKDEKFKALFKIIVHGGHSPTLASLTGAGNSGIKSDSKGGVPLAVAKEAAPLFRPEAGFNKEIYSHSEKKNFYLVHNQELYLKSAKDPEAIITYLREAIFTYAPHFREVKGNQSIFLKNGPPLNFTLSGLNYLKGRLENHKVVTLQEILKLVERKEKIEDPHLENIYSSSASFLREAIKYNKLVEQEADNKSSLNQRQ